MIWRWLTPPTITREDHIWQWLLLPLELPDELKFSADKMVVYLTARWIMWRIGFSEPETALTAPGFSEKKTIAVREFSEKNSRRCRRGVDPVKTLRHSRAGSDDQIRAKAWPLIRRRDGRPVR